MTEMAPHRGTKVLVFGILSILCCFIFGIFAIIWGGEDLKAMDAGRMDPSGRGLTNAGRICGIIGCVWTAVAIVLRMFGVLAMPGQ